jgi:ubiquinone/menaquinone biosynthesis C-methylase UbiE
MSFSEPDKIIASINLSKDDHVADIGAGTGFYSFAAAKAVGPSGRVFALDVQKDLLERLKKEATHLGIGNITTVWVDAEKPNGTRLRDHSIHVAIVANILFQVEDKDGLLNEIQRILSREGRVLVVDWTESFGGLGPSSDQVFNQQAATDLFTKYGFKVQATVEAGAHHYGLVFQK